MGFFQFLFKTEKNPYIRSVLKQDKSDQTKALLAMLPAIAAAFSEGADSIYRKLLQEQFKDYEERYGCSLLALINEEKQKTLVRIVTGFMLYTVCNTIAEMHPEIPSTPLTAALHFEIYQEKPSQGASCLAGSFLDYLNYENKNFEDRRLAPAFKFGNEIAQIMETMDIAFSFMASQQAVLIAEITRRILAGLLSKQAEAPA